MSAGEPWPDGALLPSLPILDEEETSRQLAADRDKYATQPLNWRIAQLERENTALISHCSILRTVADASEAYYNNAGTSTPLRDALAKLKAAGSALPILTEDERTAIAEVFTYLEANERYHYNNDPSPDHIWLRCAIVRDVLKRLTGCP